MESNNSPLIPPNVYADGSEQCALNTTVYTTECGVISCLTEQVTFTGFVDCRFIKYYYCFFFTLDVITRSRFGKSSNRNETKIPYSMLSSLSLVNLSYRIELLLLFESK